MTNQGDTMTEHFLPRVTFTDRHDARDAYFALAAMTNGAGNDLAKAARDDSVTVAQLDLIIVKHQRLNDLTGVVFAEWQRLEQDDLTTD